MLIYLIHAFTECICWYIFNTRIFLSIHFKLQIIIIFTDNNIVLVAILVPLFYNAAIIHLFLQMHMCYWHCWNKMLIFCFSFLYHVSVWCCNNPVSLHSLSKFHLIIMFITLGGSVNPRFAETRLYNPLSSLQSLTQLYASPVLGISSIRHSLNLIPPQALPNLKTLRS